MVPALVSVLLLATPGNATTPAKPVGAIRAEGAAPVSVVTLAGAADVVQLCQRLVPTERLRVKGDMVDQGETSARHESERGQALGARYLLEVAPAKLPFAPYDGPEQRLSVSEPATIRLSGGVTLFATMDRGLPVQVDAEVARRILAAQAAGRLVLRLTFDLPDDAVCTSDRRATRFTLGLEPVEWTWRDGAATLAWGGVAADRPAVSLAGGAQAKVDVGEPIAGPSAARKAVLARKAALVACYTEGLRQEPALDGVVVVDLGPRVAVSADSTGSPELARCVERALGPLAGATPASVPIRFELALPKPGAKGAEVDGAAPEPAAVTPDP